jgi:hypothetical protein
MLKYVVYVITRACNTRNMTEINTNRERLTVMCLYYQ